MAFGPKIAVDQDLASVRRFGRLHMEVKRGGAAGYLRVRLQLRHVPVVECTSACGDCLPQVARAGMAPKIVLAEASPGTLSVALLRSSIPDREARERPRLYSEDEARALFREVKRYLFLNRVTKARYGRCTPFASMRSGTNSYFLRGSTLDFCTRYYGAYSTAQPQQRAGLRQE